MAGLVFPPGTMRPTISDNGVSGMSIRTQLIIVKPAADFEAKTADGHFPILNEDWIGSIVLAIDDAEVPEIIRHHGARYRNQARYVIDLGHGEYLLYGGNGELLDMCVLK